MNDREMLELLAGERGPTAACLHCGAAVLLGQKHKPGCWIGNHLHPEAVVGSDKWALATGRAGRKVCRRAWKGRDYLYRDETGQWRHSGGTTGLTPASYPNTHDWELYAPPEPETVRWVVKDGWLERGERGSTYAAIDAIYGRVLGGYRLDHFVGHTADGREVKMGTLLKMWCDPCGFYARASHVPTSKHTEPVWATHAVMERVAQ